MTKDEHKAVAAAIANAIKAERERHQAELGAILARIDASDAAMKSPAGIVKTTVNLIVKEALTPMVGEISKRFDRQQIMLSAITEVVGEESVSAAIKSQSAKRVAAIQAKSAKQIEEIKSRSKK